VLEAACEEGRVDAGNGRRAQQLQDEIKGLTEERDSWRRAEERVESTLDGTPRLRDRNRFVNSLLNGELATVERIGPLWQERRRCSREIARVGRQLAAKKNKLGTVVRRGLEAGDSGYRALLAKANQEKAVKRSCQQLRDAIRAARTRIKRASRRPRNAESDSEAKLDVAEVVELIRAVRKCVVDVNEKVSALHSFDTKAALKLDTDFPVGSGQHKARIQKYEEVNVLLGSLDRSVKSLLHDAEAGEQSVEIERRRYVKTQLSRFDGTAE
jgi:hypothetical protein